HEGGAPGLVDRLEALAQAAEHRWIDAARGLVEQYQARACHERHRHVEQLLLSVAQGARALLGERREAEEIDHAVRRGAEAGVARPEQARPHAALVLLAGKQ